MSKVKETLKSNFIQYEFTVDFEETSTKYLFNKNDLTHEQIDTLAETFTTLYDDEIFIAPFDDYLNALGIDFHNLGENKI